MQNVNISTYNHNIDRVQLLIIEINRLTTELSTLEINIDDSRIKEINIELHDLSKQLNQLSINNLELLEVKPNELGMFDYSVEHIIS